MAWFSWDYETGGSKYCCVLSIPILSEAPLAYSGLHVRAHSIAWKGSA